MYQYENSSYKIESKCEPKEILFQLELMGHTCNSHSIIQLLLEWKIGVARSSNIGHILRVSGQGQQLGQPVRTSMRGWTYVEAFTVYVS